MTVKKRGREGEGTVEEGSNEEGREETECKMQACADTHTIKLYSYICQLVTSLHA